MADPSGARARVGVAALALLGAALVPAGAEAAPAGCGGRITTTRDGWQRVAAPAFARGGRAVTAFAVGPEDARTLLATNGTAIAHSTDGGCRWRDAYALPDAPADAVGARARIVDVVATSGPLYAVVADATAPRVLVSADRGRSWTAADLPAVQPRDVAVRPKLVADNRGTHAYLLAGSGSGAAQNDVVYATRDAGRGWSANPVPAGYPVEPHLAARDIGVDPVDGRSVWLSTSAGLLESTDGARTWLLRENSERGNDLSVLSVARRAGDPVQVLVASNAEDLLHVRGAVGGLTVVNTPGPVRSVAAGRNGTEAAIETPSGIYELDFYDLTWAPAHRGSPRLSRLTSDRTAAAHFYACACDGDGSIWSRAPRAFLPELGAANVPPFPGEDGCAPSRRRMRPVEFPPSAVLPAADEVTVPPGGSRTVSYRFRVRPRELGVYFLVDTGHRATTYACAASQGGAWAAQHLARIRNLRAGLGVYRDYPAQTGARDLLVDAKCARGEEKPFVYRRLLPAAPVGYPLQQAMANIDVTWCQSGRAGLAALLQAATGEGQDVPPLGTSPLDLPGSHDAGFAEDAFKVVVHVTGGSFAAPERDPGYPGPGFDRTIERLAANGVQQVAIYAPPPKRLNPAGEPVSGAETGLDDLSRVARGTGAVATKPVRCGALPGSTIQPGEPLVCVFADDAGVDPVAPSMGSQFAELVTSFSDVRPMRLAVLSGDGTTVGGVSPAAPRHLDHLAPQTLTYDVTYRCARDEAGSAKAVELGGQVGDTVVARTTTVVRCGEAAVPRRLPEIASLVAGLQLAAPGPQAPNAPTGNNAPQTNTQPQSGAQHAGSGAATPQEDQAPRLAFAHANDAAPAEEQLEMSARSRRKPYDVPPWMLVEVALLAGAAAYGAHRRRTAPQPAVRRQRF
ncbi:MAG TPA: hypothetical protein VNA20_00220 [Frankiaceae bacterium]|nr:hypothetical protein [Frankiaceae bacterium]